VLQRSGGEHVGRHEVATLWSLPLRDAGNVPPDITSLDAYKSVTPFILLDLVAIVIIIFIPQIATILPNLMMH
jgi:TRAP-type mannitol/chloroaromatic compound transport system permease large subunit